MRFWFLDSTNRRADHNRQNGINLPNLRPSFSGYLTESSDDLILAQGNISIDRSAAGEWGNGAIFISKTELSTLIDFLVQNPNTFPEVADKVIERLRALVEQKP